MTAPVAVPTNELVAVAWVKTFAGDQAGTNLPADVTKWATTGFVQLSTVGGSPHMDYALMRPVLAVDAWAAGSGTNKPPFGKANALAELVKNAALDPARSQLIVTLPNGLGDVLVQSVWPLSEPRKVPNDPAGYARYTFDLQMIWTRQ